MNYDFWKQSLAGEKPKMFVDDPQLGFYRRGVYEKREGKARKRVGWEPVAIYFNTGEGLIGAAIGQNHTTDRDKINELWSYCAGYPISEETYRAVAERGEPWPDSHEEPEKNGTKMPEESPAEKIAREIAECQKLLAKYATIESDEQSSKARSLQQRFLDLRGEAKKHYEAANRPLLDQQKALRAVWTPLQDAADAASVTLRKAMGGWEDTKREAARRAEEETRKRQEEANRDHQFENSKPGQIAYGAPPVEPVRPNTPPPSQQIRGGTGRAARVTVQKFVTVIDVDKVFQQFRDAPEIIDALTEIAQRAVRAGIPVPGATVIERSDVR